MLGPMETCQVAPMATAAAMCCCLWPCRSILHPRDGSDSFLRDSIIFIAVMLVSKQRRAGGAGDRQQASSAVFCLWFIGAGHIFTGGDTPSSHP